MVRKLPDPGTSLLLAVPDFSICRISCSPAERRYSGISPVYSPDLLIVQDSWFQSRFKNRLSCLRSSLLTPSGGGEDDAITHPALTVLLPTEYPVSSASQRSPSPIRRLPAG